MSFCIFSHLTLRVGLKTKIRAVVILKTVFSAQVSVFSLPLCGFEVICPAINCGVIYLVWNVCLLLNYLKTMRRSVNSLFVPCRRKMSRTVLTIANVHPTIRAAYLNYNKKIVQHVVDTINKDAVVVVGMAVCCDCLRPFHDVFCSKIPS